MTLPWDSPSKKLWTLRGQEETVKCLRREEVVKSVLMSAEFFLLPFKSLLFSASYNCRHTQEVVDFVVVKMLDPEVDPFSRT